MRYALNLGEDGRVLSVTREEFATEDMPLVDNIPEDDVSDYRYVDGEFISDPLPEPEPDTRPTQEERISELESMMNALLGVSE